MITTELISALKIKGSFPSANDLFSNSDFLVLFNHQMKTEIVPIMLMLSEDYFLLTKDFNVVQNASYRLPSRGIGSKLRDLQVQDTGGNLIPLKRLFEEDRPANLTGYYIVRNSVELANQFVSGTLKMKYYARPNELVMPTECAQVVSIDSGNLQIEVSSVPATMTTGVLCDFVQNRNPYDLLSYDNAIAGVSGTTITMTEIPTDLVVGDWLCIAQKSPVPMVPEELHPVLVQAALVSALSAKKDRAFEAESKVLERNKQDAIRMLDPRVENDSVSFRSGRLLNFFANRWY